MNTSNDSYFIGQVIDGPLGRYTLRTAADVALRRAVSGSGNPVIVETPATREKPDDSQSLPLHPHSTQGDAP